MNDLACKTILIALAFCGSASCQFGEAPANPAETPTLAVYDTRDLIGPGPDAPGAAETTAESPTGLSQPGPAERLAAFLAAFVQPPLAADEEIVSTESGYLVANMRPAQHAWMKAFLNQARAQTKQPITLEVTFLEIPDKTFTEIVAPLTSKPKARTRSSFTLAAGATTEDWLESLRVSDTVNSLIAPRLAALPLQSVSVSTLDQTAYVRDFEPGGAGVPAKPIVDVVRSGIIFETMAMVTADGGTATRYRFTKMDLQQPMPKFETKIGSETVTIDLPEVHIESYVQEAIVPAASTLVTCVPNGEADASWIVVTLTAAAM